MVSTSAGDVRVLGMHALQWVVASLRAVRRGWDATMGSVPLVSLVWPPEIPLRPPVVALELLRMPEMLLSSAGVAWSVVESVLVEVSEERDDHRGKGMLSYLCTNIQQ